MARAMTRQQFAQYGMTNVPEDMVEKYARDILKDKRFGERLYGETLDRKLFRGIEASVTEDPKSVTVEEFNALFK